MGVSMIQLLSMVLICFGFVLFCTMQPNEFHLLLECYITCFFDFKMPYLFLVVLNLVSSAAAGIFMV